MKHVAVKRNRFIICLSKSGKRGTSENQRYFVVFRYKKWKLRNVCDV